MAYINGNQVLFSPQMHISSEDNYDVGYEAGQLSVLKNSKYMNATASGEVISVDDVSPIEHELGVSLTSENITDFSNVKISRMTSNLFGGKGMADKMQELTPSVTREGNNITYATNAFVGKTLFDAFKENTVYTFIFKGINTSTTKYLNLTLTYTDGTRSDLAFATANEINTIVFKSSKGKTIRALRGIQFTGTVTMYCDECGIFEGDIDISMFEPYIEPQTVQANEDGTVVGLKSISPNMTVLSDTEGVTISCRYLCDIDTYIDNLITNIALTGGN